MAEKDGDRLPWLGPMPERSAAPKQRAAVRGLTMIVVLLTVGLAGMLSLTFLRGSPDAPVAETAVPAPVATAQLPASKPPPPAEVLPPAAASPAPARLAAATPTRAKAATAKQAQRAKQRRAAARRLAANRAKARARARASAKAEARARAQAAAGVTVHRGITNYPPVPWVGTPGTVIQLGAFTSPSQADIAWRGSVRAYPYLATLPRLVTKVRVGPKRMRYYRLQLGTASPVHAAQICRNLRGIRRSCIVT